MPKQRKYFITGVFGSGKTYFAKKLSNSLNLPYIDFDKLFNYKKKKNQARSILEQLPHQFIIDAIPFDVKTLWDDFLAYERKYKPKIVCLYCPQDVWKERIYYRKKITYPIRTLYDLAFHTVRLTRRLRKAKIYLEDEIKLFHEYRDFFITFYPYLKQFSKVKYFDTSRNEWTSGEEMLKRVKFHYFKLENHLYDQDYDKYYQDIELINFIGYSESYKTWGNIKNLVKWDGKKIVDLGCFHGYFSFKAEDRGARSVMGLDNHGGVLKTAKMINDFRKGKAVFKYWVGSQNIPNCDIILCLNVLHHFDNPLAAVKKMNCELAIFEINKSDVNTVKSRFKIVQESESLRKNRIILLCKRID